MVPPVMRRPEQPGSAQWRHFHIQDLQCRSCNQPFRRLARV